MESRTKNPVFVLPEAVHGIGSMLRFVSMGGTRYALLGVPASRAGPAGDRRARGL